MDQCAKYTITVVLLFYDATNFVKQRPAIAKNCHFSNSCLTDNIHQLLQSFSALFLPRPGHAIFQSMFNHVCIAS